VLDTAPWRTRLRQARTKQFVSVALADYLGERRLQVGLSCQRPPAAIAAAWPTTVTRSRCPRALARRTQKPFSALW